MYGYDASNRRFGPRGDIQLAPAQRSHEIEIARQQILGPEKPASGVILCAEKTSTFGARNREVW
jgi:hypothetical protein